MAKADVDSLTVEIPDFVDPGGYGDVSGQMAIQGTDGGSKAEDYNTLDEPIKDTILRDLKAVGTKFFHVLYPKEKKALLKEWDLWGPLILCTFLAMILQGSTEDVNDMKDGGPQFAEVFVIVWVGSGVVTLNSKLLGGNISFFQSVCVLGYCLLPSCLSLIFCRIILIGGTESSQLFVLRLAVTCLGFAWASYAAMKFLGDSQPPPRKALAVYPIFLFYFFIGWLIISHSSV
ncbi:Protein YIPF6 [Armadillidium nasatum]|uniref:Protein YIPF n=1 Tax=Armadillidium nasatum TaxID=96803 RepID=A0A5N5T573_9CRUS|nr:Protein YIPF6 [Armadillidium nasatum]